MNTADVKAIILLLGHTSGLNINRLTSLFQTPGHACE